MALYQRQYYKSTQVSKKNLNLLSRNCLFIIYVYIYIYIHIIFKVLKTTRKNADEGDHPDSLIKLSRQSCEIFHKRESASSSQIVNC